MSKEQEIGDKMALLGGSIYLLADQLPMLEENDDFQQMMFLLNKLSYRLIHGKPRPGEEGNDAGSVTQDR
jgi:hypothetical protein